MTEWVALLQGINVGRRRIKMDALRAGFAQMGFADARTLIASGNVLFSAPEAPDLAARIAAGLEGEFGFVVPTILRRVSDLEAMRDADPFAAYPESDAQKRYVYFLGEPVAAALDLPIAEPGDFEIFAATQSDVFAVAHKQPSGRFGTGLDRFKWPVKTVMTARNWTTVNRLLDLAQGKDKP